MLSSEERRWLEEEGQDTFGLPEARMKTLLAILEREAFSLRDIAVATDQTRENVRLAIEAMVSRELIEYRALPPPRSHAPYRISIGRRLRFILDAVRARRPVPERRSIVKNA